ncbi:hypothetical protein [Evansella halocellulosilytica]|uniref:hypothetical protein n=1 Tax=Evansella halocellulosilytica TaxID=2011013 RepID=UPI0015CA85AB|nr:hypothetical protein [Evansella halocellulosilytica]
MSRRIKTVAERMYTDPKIAFNELMNSIINNKIDEIVNNADKVNTATSQKTWEGLDEI